MRREKFDIIAEILGIAANGGVAKTHLMYKSNLDYKQLKRYLSFVTENGLLLSTREDGNHDSYHLTDKGRDLLQLYGDMQKLLSQG